MTTLYWPDFDCTAASRAIEHESTVHEHYDSHQAAARGWLADQEVAVADWHAGRRYKCIRGPGGIVRGVRR